MFLALSTVIFVFRLFVQTSGLTITRANYDYENVPRDLDASVTHLDLKKNRIKYIDGSSFALYSELKAIGMNQIPLEEIRPGSFNNNYFLEQFECKQCKIKQLPVDFGGATTSLRKMDLKFGIQNPAVLMQVQWQRFINFKHIELWGNVIMDPGYLHLPSTLKVLDIANTKMHTFPDLSATRFPQLQFLRGNGNNFTKDETIFHGSSNTIYSVNLNGCNLKSVKGIENLPNLVGLQIVNNNLDTVPDLSGLIKLNKLLIAHNTRMTCDHRMCWRRLLNRVRTPLQAEDNVICVLPTPFAGHPLSTVNPKFMECAIGNSFPTIFSYNAKDCVVHGSVTSSMRIDDDVIKWKYFPRNWPFVLGIHRSRWIPHTKASDAELWCFLWSASE